MIVSSELEAVAQLRFENLESSPSSLIFLEGEMGAGKSSLVRGWIQKELNLIGKNAVSAASPTFALVHEYPSLNCIHADLYRLKSEEEIFEIGLEDAISRSQWSWIEWGSLFPEWKERWIRSFPGRVYEIQLSFLDHQPDQRQLSLVLHKAR